MNRGELNIFAGGSGCVTADTEVEVVILPNIKRFAAARVRN